MGMRSARGMAARAGGALAIPTERSAKYQKGSGNCEQGGAPVAGRFLPGKKKSQQRLRRLPAMATFLRERPEKKT